MSTVRLEAVKMDNAAQEIPMQPASADIWDKKYRLKTKSGEAIDADIDGTYQRVAKALAEATGGRPDLAVYVHPVTEAGRVELLPFLHEQAISITAHRFGTPNHISDALI